MTNEVTKLAVMGTNLEYIKKDIAEIKQSVRDLSNVYATQVSLDELKKEVSAIKNSNGLWKWAAPAIAAIIAVVIEFLFIQYLQNLHCIGACVK
jgi:anti-sigma-K factor RskA